MTRRRHPAWPKKTTVGAASFYARDRWFFVTSCSGGWGKLCGFSGLEWLGGGEIGTLVLDRLLEKIVVLISYDLDYT
jgi:hypothetical protein